MLKTVQSTILHLTLHPSDNKEFPHSPRVIVSIYYLCRLAVYRCPDEANKGRFRFFQRTLKQRVRINVKPEVIKGYQFPWSKATESWCRFQLQVVENNLESVKNTIHHSLKALVILTDYSKKMNRLYHGRLWPCLLSIILFASFRDGRTILKSSNHAKEANILKWTPQIIKLSFTLGVRE